MRDRIIVAFCWLLLMGTTSSAAETPHQSGDPLAIFPDTTAGIHVFNDQIDVHNLSEAQAEFAAIHYDGTQKLTLAGAQRLRAYNPNFVVLHYRLGLGIGYRVADANCQPTGEYLSFIHGNDWVQEWPGDDVIQEDWLYHRDGQRVYWCDWGWYLADIQHPGWRAWWLDQITTQLADNQNNGLFADSVTVPNFLGGYSWFPTLPDYDEAFEAEWTARLNDWMVWVNTAFGDEYVLIVNAGQLVTSRETTDYSLADGVMIEGFAGWGEYERFEFGDWQLQMDRALNLINQDRAVILQSYVWDTPERLWTLANYLLIKGSRTYINLEVTQDAEWFPEYDIPIGAPLDASPAAIQDLQHEAGLYVRPYTNGLIVVNPDPYGSPRSLALDQPMHLITDATGGGDLPENAAISGWGVITSEVSAITLDPGQAAILLGEVGESAAQVVTAESEAASISEQASASPATDLSIDLSADLTAFHRSGQTFLLWPEVPDDLQMTYSIYRSTAPLTANNLTQAQKLTEIPQGSGIYWTERVRALDPPWEDSGYVSLRNYVIDDRGEQLPDGMGLFVWSTHENGDFYYAVTTRSDDWVGTVGPITEQISDPAAIRVWQAADGLSRVYTQFMDYSTYNNSFDAPRYSNFWMGLPNWEELETMAAQQQYAYNYWVGLPTPELCEGTVPDVLPLVLHIEGWGSRYTAPADALYFCAVHLWPDDPNQSWYFGFSATHDYRRDALAASGPIVNYTEERILRALHEVIADPDLPTIDENRIYVYGHSMGGTGALAFAQRYPQIFAAAFANQPMMNFATAEEWVNELRQKWGSQENNFPIELRGPDAAHLAAYQGTGVWDWQNLGGQLAARRGDEMAFIGIIHGIQDSVIDWETIVQPAYKNFYTGNRGFLGVITNDDHTWIGFIEHPNYAFYALNFPRDESFPALTHASGSLAMPPLEAGTYNLTLEWSSSINDFAGLPVDTPDEWVITLRSMAGEQTVDVTPRRLQQFVITPGVTYQWENRRADNGELMQSGTITPDADGLLTVPFFIVSETGNQLIIRR
ncbi:MAG: alpha/beta fold hydrolase [Anaerolineae bacterium]|nr:alpha/beta fold hydrolase [Anaerolineae bacterium]